MSIATKDIVYIKGPETFESRTDTWLTLLRRLQQMSIKSLFEIVDLRRSRTVLYSKSWSANHAFLDSPISSLRFRSYTGNNAKRNNTRCNKETFYVKNALKMLVKKTSNSFKKFLSHLSITRTCESQQVASNNKVKHQKVA